MHPEMQHGAQPASPKLPREQIRKGQVPVAHDAITLARRVSRLNPDAGEIGEGMLRTLVEEARHVIERWEAVEG